MIAVLFSAPTVFARKPGCMIAFDQDANEGNHNYMKRGDLVRNVAEYIKKDPRVPTLEEFAEYIQTSPTELRRYFKNSKSVKNIKELIELARNNSQTQGIFRQLEKKMLSEAARFFRTNYRLPETVEELAEPVLVHPDHFETIYGKIEDLYAVMKKTHPRHVQITEDKILAEYAKASKSIRETPSIAEVASALGVTKEQMEKLIGEGKMFESEKDLDEKARLKKPKAFVSVLNTHIYTKEYKEKAIRAARNADRMIVTSATSGAEIHQEAIDAMMTYSRENGNCPIFVIPLNNQTEGLPAVLLELPNVFVVTHTILLGETLRISNIHVMQNQMNPNMGLKRLGSRIERWIVGSPKMHMTTEATDRGKIAPRQEISTGSISRRQYFARTLSSERQTEFARKEHLFGGVVLEKNLTNSRFFKDATVGDWHIRNIEFFEETGGFWDLDTFYSSKGTSKQRPRALVFGDMHVGDTDPRLVQSAVEQVMKFNPEVVAFHDLINGHSINHHEKERVLSMLKTRGFGKHRLDVEFRAVAQFLNAFHKMFPKVDITIIPSNHDYWVFRWITEQWYLKDEPHNIKLGWELSTVAAAGHDPIMYALRKYGLHEEAENRIKYFKLGENFRVGDYAHRFVNLAHHGDKGANGARGSLSSHEVGADRSVYGHSHRTEYKNGTVNIGTSTYLDLDYAVGGYSSWVGSLALVGNDGAIQVLQHQFGEWYAKRDQNIGKRFGAKFFKSGYPRLEHNEEKPVDVGNADQYDRNDRPTRRSRRAKNK